MNKLLMTATAAFLALGTAVNAASLTINDGYAASIPGVAQSGTPENDALDALGLPTTLAGFLGSSIELSDVSTLHFEFFGAEALATSSLTAYGNTFNHDGSLGRIQLAPDLNSPLDSFYVSNVAAGLVDFSFASFVFGVNSAVTNGGVNGTQNAGLDGLLNTADDFATGTNFFASFSHDATARSGNSLLLFFDDSGTPGDNHDDFVIRISAVPLPAGLLLMGTALAGLGFTSRRGKKA